MSVFQRKPSELIFLTIIFVYIVKPSLYFDVYIELTKDPAV